MWIESLRLCLAQLRVATDIVGRAGHSLQIKQTDLKACFGQDASTGQVSPVVSSLSSCSQRAVGILLLAMLPVWSSDHGSSVEKLSHDLGDFGFGR